MMWLGIANTAWTWLRRNPALALCAILALYGLNERRLHHSWRDYSQRLIAASQAAEKATKALRETERAQSKELAHEADEHHAQTVVAVRSRTDDYVAKHRVPTGGQCAAVAVDQTSDPHVPAPVSTGVVVDERDVQTCGDLYAYSLAAHQWAVSVGE